MRLPKTPSRLPANDLRHLKILQAPRESRHVWRLVRVPRWTCWGRRCYGRTISATVPAQARASPLFVSGGRTLFHGTSDGGRCLHAFVRPKNTRHPQNSMLYRCSQLGLPTARRLPDGAFTLGAASLSDKEAAANLSTEQVSAMTRERLVQVARVEGVLFRYVDRLDLMDRRTLERLAFLPQRRCHNQSWARSIQCPV